MYYYCNDGQVVKHAITINLSPNDEMTITPYQVAPCYMKSAECSRWQLLKLGTSVPIKPGDVCSLLPDKCWFKIVSVPETMEENDETLERKSDEDLNDKRDNVQECLSSSIEAVMCSGEAPNAKDSSVKHESSPINENNNTNTPKLQDIYSASSPEGDNISETHSKVSSDSQDVVERHNEERGNRKRKIDNINLTSEVSTNVELEKRMKRDCEPNVSDQIKSSTEKDSQSESSQPQASASNSEIPNVPKREKCAYGTRCYRKNPNHKNNYSHPGDSDYNEVDREECPFGIKCYRKNPQHKAQFKHTSRCRKTTSVKHIAPDITSDTEVSEESAVESVDESEYDPSIYSESSETKSDWEDSRSDWEDGTTG